MTQPHYSPHLASCNFWLFPKLESPLKGKRFQILNEIQENMMGWLMATVWTVWGPKVPTLRGTKVSLSYAQCFLYLVSSSIVSPFFVLHSWIPSDKGAKKIHWRKDRVISKLLEQLSIHVTKLFFKTHCPYLAIYTKINSKLSLDLHVKSKTIKLLKFT